MAYFELFYLNSLKKNTKRIDKFLENWPEQKGTMEVISVLKLNKSRKKMRAALGMDLNTPVEEAMMRFWTLGDFLNQGKANKREVSKEIKKDLKKINDIIDNSKTDNLRRIGFENLLKDSGYPIMKIEKKIDFENFTLQDHFNIFKEIQL